MENFDLSMSNFKEVLTFIIFLLSFILLYEFFLRITEISAPSFVYDDKLLGRTYKPNSEIFMIGAEGFYMGQVNEYGFLGELPKNENALRIALIGDSYIEGLQLFERHHFKAKLEKCLSEKLKISIEILNFGIGGIDFRDMYFNYIHKARRFNPDIVLFYVKKSNLLLKEKFPIPEYYVDNDSLKLSYAFLNSKEARIRRKFSFIRDFAIGYLFKETYEVYANGNLINKIFNGLIEINKNNNTIIGSSNEKDLTSLFDLNKKIFEELEKETEENNVKFILLITDDFPEEYYTLMNSFKGLKKIIIPKELNDYKNKEFRYWKASGKMGHWNHNAHKKVAEFLCPYFEKLLIENKISVKN